MRPTVREFSIDYRSGLERLYRWLLGRGEPGKRFIAQSCAEARRVCDVC